jgi:hypothetical protein
VNAGGDCLIWEVTPFAIIKLNHWAQMRKCGRDDILGVRGRQQFENIETFGSLLIGQ